MLQKGVYRHYKGGLYEVIDIAEHSETQEKLVIYRSKETRKLWARPVEMFLETVEVSGEMMPRFVLNQLSSEDRKIIANGRKAYKQGENGKFLDMNEVFFQSV